MFPGEVLKKSGREADDTTPLSVEFRTEGRYLIFVHRVNLSVCLFDSSW